MNDRERVEQEEDYIVNPRCENSLKVMLLRFKDEPIPDDAIVKALALESTKELEDLFISTVAKLRAYMGTDK